MRKITIELIKDCLKNKLNKKSGKHRKNDDVFLIIPLRDNEIILTCLVIISLKDYEIFIADKYSESVLRYYGYDINTLSMNKNQNHKGKCHRIASFIVEKFFTYMINDVYQFLKQFLLL